MNSRGVNVKNSRGANVKKLANWDRDRVDG